MAEAGRSEAEQLASIIELENALIALVVQHGARTVAEKAQELYQHTKEWRDEQSSRPRVVEEDAWERASRAPEGRTPPSGGRRQLAFEEARRALGG